jgi:hypothetical protein
MKSALQIAAQIGSGIAWLDRTRKSCHCRDIPERRANRWRGACAIVAGKQARLLTNDLQERQRLCCHALVLVSFGMLRWSVSICDLPDVEKRTSQSVSSPEL